MEVLNTVLAFLGLLYLCLPAFTQKLSATGKNVCLSPRDSSHVCCSGWAQQGDECTIPLCEGESACTEDEQCVFPGFCRCKPGFFGFQCKTPCPPEFWGSDCKEQCPCYPYGTCNSTSGVCKCFPTRWGSMCQNICKCGRHGHCDPLHGNCTCDEGWWSSTCTKVCQCHPSTSTCDPGTGQCLCKKGFWGQKCSLRCECYLSPCQQNTGECRCINGWWGPNCDRRCICDLRHSECEPLTGECLCQSGYRSPFCNEPCSTGYYGSGCTESCGHCEGNRSCSRQDGSCESCAPGWNGSRCDQPCPPGYYGHKCQEKCPLCRKGETCDTMTGTCSHCEPGWTGPRCDQPCVDGTFGNDCHFLCRPCYNGRCDHITGKCVCHPGFQGESCNSSCPDHLYGINCSSMCDCGDETCHPVTGVCPYSSRAGFIALGLLIPLLVLLLAVLFCCCCCGSPAVGKDRVAEGDGSRTSRMKHHVYTVLANMSLAMPCLTFWSSGLPRVTVSHHDPELTFNHSFIEPPSANWVTDSFETDEDGEAVYCVPPREDIPAVAGGEFQFQELSSKCNMFPEPSTFSSEDMSLAFGIPRTSSIAKSKRPSVSFAEGTKFSSKERRGSTQENTRKAKTPWGVLMLSSLQGGQGAHEEAEAEKEETSDETNVSAEEQDANSLPEADTQRYSSTPSRNQQTIPGSRRPLLSNPRKNLQPQALSGGQETDTGTEKASTTIYMTVGKPVRASKPDMSSEGPVQAMLRRLGSIQRQREEAGQPKSKGPAVAKPPRRKLGARASMWEQASSSGQSDVVLRKPSRRKHTSLSSPCTVGATDMQQDNSAPRRPLSSILKSVPETTVQDSRTASEADAGYETVAASEEVSTSSEVIANNNLTVQDEEPKYENIYMKQ
ncbi:scavenger receptor class F member 1 [Trichomycterus rosablanca]|uniref:scavenger receptor class F member 1 n=1 Tax=Trichomycterus rosablanca TaxID=2290929 RepID=UPI002F358903